MRRPMYAVSAIAKLIFEALKKNNVKTDFITIPGADHGFRGEDAKRAMAATVSWFEQRLVKNGKPEQERHTNAAS